VAPKSILEHLIRTFRTGARTDGTQKAEVWKRDFSSRDEAPAMPNGIQVRACWPV
jgi:hypothetical protein